MRKGEYIPAWVWECDSEVWQAGAGMSSMLSSKTHPWDPGSCPQHHRKKELLGYAHLLIFHVLRLVVFPLYLRRLLFSSTLTNAVWQFLIFWDLFFSFSSTSIAKARQYRLIMNGEVGLFPNSPLSSFPRLQREANIAQFKLPTNCFSVYARLSIWEEMHIDCHLSETRI